MNLPISEYKLYLKLILIVVTVVAALGNNFIQFIQFIMNDSSNDNLTKQRKLIQTDTFNQLSAEPDEFRNCIPRTKQYGHSVIKPKSIQLQTDMNYR